MQTGVRVIENPEYGVPEHGEGVDTMKHLITKYRVKIDARNNYSDTPLCLAALYGQIDIVKIIR